MKIAFVLSRCRMAGSSRNVIEVSRYFSGLGHEVHVFANECDPLDRIAQFHKIPAFTRNFLLRESMTTLLETLAMKTHKFDVTVAAPSRYFSPDVCHVRILNRSDLENAKSLTGRADLSTKITCVSEGRNLRKAKQIIAMSNAVKESILKYYDVPVDKITVIYDGVNLRQFDVRNKREFRSEIRKVHGIGENERLLLFAGNPFSRKGLEYLVRALPTVTDKHTRLMILGKDDIAPYMKLAQELGVADRIVYAGFTTEIHKYFAAADAFVFPTLYEPFGLVILEAMASGLPVITSAAAGAAELIENGKEGLLLKDPKDGADIAAKINLLGEKTLAERLGNAARKRAEHYTWEKTAAEMLKVFEKVRKF